MGKGADHAHCREDNPSSVIPTMTPYKHLALLEEFFERTTGAPADASPITDPEVLDLLQGMDLEAGPYEDAGRIDLLDAVSMGAMEWIGRHDGHRAGDRVNKVSDATRLALDAWRYLESEVATMERFHDYCDAIEDGEEWKIGASEFTEDSPGFFLDTYFHGFATGVCERALERFRYESILELRALLEDRVSNYLFGTGDLMMAIYALRTEMGELTGNPDPVDEEVLEDLAEALAGGSIRMQIIERLGIDEMGALDPESEIFIQIMEARARRVEGAGRLLDRGDEALYEVSWIQGGVPLPEKLRLSLMEQGPGDPEPRGPGLVPS